ncbi:MAG: clan AA aspartic protease [Oceanospirillaceae bacterium]|nr:clan AA aspartic protease [Oceanospirillaceae bacterium]
MRRIIYGLLFIFLGGILPVSAAQIYQYVNDKGRKIYVNRLSLVPAKYRSQLKVRAEVINDISADQQAVYNLQNKKYANSITLRSEISKLKKIQASISTQVAIRDNQVIVPVEVTYKGSAQTLNLLLDTGASITVIHSSSLRNFTKEHLKSSLAKVAGGSIIKTWLLNLKGLTFGPYNYSTKQVMVIDLSGKSKFDGLLGMDVLARTDYKIDFAKQRILWDTSAMSKLEQRLDIMQLELEQLD